MTSKLATVTTGVKRFFHSRPHGSVVLFATAKAGVATGDGSATAVFGGGGNLKVLLAGAATTFPFLKLFSTIPNSYVSGTVSGRNLGRLAHCRAGHATKIRQLAYGPHVAAAIVGTRQRAVNRSGC